MGLCCSKEIPNFSSPAPKLDPPVGKIPNPNPQIDKILEEKTQIKEEPIINPSKINEPHQPLVEKIAKSDKKTISLANENSPENNNMINSGGVVVRTSSCTRDEIDAILIQCGRLSRSSSTVQTPSRKKNRSFDLDQETENADVANTRESRGQSRPSPNRRRTPSREREREKEKNQLSQRRVSRSPVRRSESPLPATCQNPGGRPGKMVSVPATDKSCNGEGPTAEAVKKVAAKRGPHRSKSPANRANARVGMENQAQGGLISLSRSNSRKAGDSPYRRNPLAEIDQNSQKQGLENTKNIKTKTDNIAINTPVAPSKPEPHNPQALTRTRSKRLSRDLDNLNLEPQIPPPSYTSLLLEDIQNFHNKIPMKDKEPPLMETEVVAMTMKEEKEESSGSNSFVGGAQYRVSPSLWETNSNDSSDCWASSSRSSNRDDDRGKREIDRAKTAGIGRGRVVQPRPVISAATA